MLGRAPESLEEEYPKEEDSCWACKMADISGTMLMLYTGALPVLVLHGNSPNSYKALLKVMLRWKGQPCDIVCLEVITQPNIWGCLRLSSCLLQVTLHTLRATKHCHVALA